MAEYIYWYIKKLTIKFSKGLEGQFHLQTLVGHYFLEVLHKVYMLPKAQNQSVYFDPICD